VFEFRNRFARWPKDRKIAARRDDMDSLAAMTALG
jgi:hypothetical protein